MTGHLKSLAHRVRFAETLLYFKNFIKALLPALKFGLNKENTPNLYLHLSIFPILKSLGLWSFTSMPLSFITPESEYLPIYLQWQISTLNAKIIKTKIFSTHKHIFKTQLYFDTQCEECMLTWFAVILANLWIQICTA